MNHISAENFIRSAKAPVISAGVMMAKVIWNIMKTDSGMVAASALTESIAMPCSSTRSRPPI